MTDPWEALDRADAQLAEADKATAVANAARQQANIERNRAVREATAVAGVLLESTDPFPSKRVVSADRKVQWGIFPSEKHALAFVRHSLPHLREATP